LQELAFGLAMGAEYLSILTDKGLTVKETAAKMAFHFAVSPYYFMEIAKYRAARLLWAFIVKAFDKDCNEPMFIHAETNRWNITVYDPYVNMLRTTTESMSAILAGIDVLTVMPFDLAFERPSEFAERIARNQQIILREESYFDRVIDPAAGSYYIESLTESIAAESWKLFLATEQEGGFISAMKRGFVQEQVEKTACQRDLAIATRREFSVGTNHYPDLNEIYSFTPQDYATEYCGTCKGKKHNIHDDCCCGEIDYECDCREENCDCSCCNENKRIVKPLRIYRGTREFEKLRLKTDLGKHRPKVFMLTIGNLSMRLARSQFSCNFFACAGYEIFDTIGFNTLDEGIRAAVEVKADIVVLCSSDEEYAVYAPEAYEKLKGKAILVIAGSPPCMEDLKAKGITRFIHIRSNVLETLVEFHQKLGVEL
jgi:methylmalonyl-CoA mutase